MLYKLEFVTERVNLFSPEFFLRNQWFAWQMSALKWNPEINGIPLDHLGEHFYKAINGNTHLIGRKWFKYLN